jgi:tRNA 2-thiouridine synthesizing protein E
MTATAQHGRLKNEQEWIFTTQGGARPTGQWSESAAQRIAAQSGIQLSDAHWEVIRFVRHYYLERGFVRRSRELASALNGRFKEQGGSRYLYQLFKGGPVLKACLLAGVPVPENCVDPSFGTAF